MFSFMDIRYREATPGTIPPTAHLIQSDQQLTITRERVSYLLDLLA
jgi:hypothetical protein